MNSIKKIIPFGIVGLLILTFSSCYYDNVDELYPLAGYDGACDTSGTISYSLTISSIMSNYCVNCHNGSNANGNIILDNYDGVKSAVNSGKLIPAVTQTGSKPMPPSGAKLSECKIKQIQLWVDQGSLNN